MCEAIKREVYRSKWNNQDCIIIASPEGEIETIFPIKIREPEGQDYTYTMEVSTELLYRIAFMQSKGIKVIFKP